MRTGRALSALGRSLSRAAIACLLAAAGCSRAADFATIGGRNMGQLAGEVKPVPNKIHAPFRPEGGLSVLWIGHASTLVQLDDKLVLTDPVFTKTVGTLSKRLIEPGLEAADLPPVDTVLISHLHFDHFSLGSLDLIEPKIRLLTMPEAGTVYLPHYAFPAVELKTWEAWEKDGLRVTAVPVKHKGWRYGADSAWMDVSFSGYVIEYHGMTVYFGGDTAYEAENFKETRRRFPKIDLALMPIAPIHPREFMRHTHVDPIEALQAFDDLGAAVMMPIHFDTFINSLDEPGEAKKLLEKLVAERGLGARVQILAVGEQRVFLPGPSARSGGAGTKNERLRPSL